MDDLPLELIHIIGEYLCWSVRDALRFSTVNKLFYLVTEQYRIWEGIYGGRWKTSEEEEGKENNEKLTWRDKVLLKMNCPIGSYEKYVVYDDGFGKRENEYHQVKEGELLYDDQEVLKNIKDTFDSCKMITRIKYHLFDDLFLGLYRYLEADSGTTHYQYYYCYFVVDKLTKKVIPFRLLERRPSNRAKYYKQFKQFVKAEEKKVSWWLEAMRMHNIEYDEKEVSKLDILFSRRLKRCFEDGFFDHSKHGVSNLRFLFKFGRSVCTRERPHVFDCKTFKIVKSDVEGDEEIQEMMGNSKEKYERKKVKDYVFGNNEDYEVIRKFQYVVECWDVVDASEKEKREKKEGSNSDFGLSCVFSRAVPGMVLEYGEGKLMFSRDTLCLELSPRSRYGLVKKKRS